MTNSPDNAQPAPRPVTTAEHDVLMAAARDGMTLVSKGRLVATPTAQAAPAAGAVAGPNMEALRHSANEWADMATNGLQWLRNIVAGASDAKTALENMESNLAHCRAVNDAPEVQAAIRAAAAPTPAAQADGVLEDAALLHYALADGGNQSMNWQDVYDDWNGEGYFIDALRAAYKQDAARKQGRQT